MKRLFTLFATSMALLILNGTSAQAGLIPWDYEWARTPDTGSVSADLGGTGGVSLTNEVPKSAVGSSDVVATNLRVFSSADPTTPDTISGTNGNYTLTISITDTESGDKGSLTFSGTLGGKFTISSANVENNFTGDLEQSLVLGANTYVVSIGPYSPPGPPSASNSGSIAAHVEVVEGGTIDETPEPGTLLLASCGMSLAGLAGWRKRRNKRDA